VYLGTLAVAEFYAVVNAAVDAASEAHAAGQVNETAAPDGHDVAADLNNSQPASDAERPERQ
jgi:hypothetical protein